MTSERQVREIIKWIQSLEREDITFERNKRDKPMIRTPRGVCYLYDFTSMKPNTMPTIRRQLHRIGIQLPEKPKS